MTWQEAGLRLISIGERSARFRDLTLRFTADEEVVESVIWLPNGGGKSSLMSLRSAVVLPNARDFTGSGRDDGGERKQRRLDDYVLDSDTSHTVISWTADDPSSLFGAPRRVLTGAVYEWPGRRRPADGQGGLNKIWWSAVPQAGLLDLDELPVRDSSLRTLSSFKAAMTELNTQHPELQIQFAQSQSDWERQLTRLQIDTQLARYQARMNTSEGGISRVFRFSSTLDFINLMVDVICPPQDAADVAGILNEHAANLFRRPQALTEQSFLQEAEELLKEMTAAHALVEDSQAAVRAVNVDAGRIKHALRRAQVQRTEHAEIARGRAEYADMEQGIQRRLRDKLNRQRADLRVHVAKTQLAHHERTLEQARTAEVESQLTVATWAVAAQLAAQRAHSAAAAEISEQLKPERAERAALAVRHDVHAHAALALLEEQISAHRGDLKRVTQQITDVDERIRALGRRTTELEDEERDAHRTLARAEARLNAHDAAIARARADGDLFENETPAHAHARLTDQHQEAVDGDAEQSELADTHNERAQSLAEELTQRTAHRAALETDADRLREAAERIAARRDELAAHERLLALAETDTVDPWADARQLRAALGSAIADADGRALALAVASADDDRLLSHVDAGGPLPAPVPTETVASVLRDTEVDAQSAWEVLLRDFNTEQRRAVAERRPDVASAVVVQDEGARDRAIALLGSQMTLAYVPIVTTSELAQCAAGALTGDPLPAAPLHPGLHDLDAAQVAADALRGANDVRAREVARLRERQGDDTRLLEHLSAFLEEHPNAESLTSARTRATAASEALEAADGQIAALRDEGESATRIAAEHTARAQRHRLRAATLEGKVTAVGRLADDEAAMADVREQVAAAQAHVEDLETEREAVREQLDGARTHRGALGENLAALSATLRDVERQRGAVTLADPALTPDDVQVGAVAAHGLTHVLAQYHQLRDQWQHSTGNSVLEERLRVQTEAAAKAAAAAEAELAVVGEHAEQVRERATKTAHLFGSEHCVAAHRREQPTLQACAAAVATAEGDLARARQAVQQAERNSETVGRPSVDERLDPEQLDDVAAMIDALDLQSQAAMTKETAAREQVRELLQRADKLDKHADDLGHLVSLVLPDSAPDSEPDDEVVEPFAGTVEDARRLVDHVRTRISTANGEAIAAASERSKVARAAVQLAGRSAYQQLTLTIRDRLADGDENVLGKMSETYLEEVRTRLVQLADLIAQIEKDKDRVTERTAVKVRLLLDGIAGAARASVVPPGLGDMSGQQFISIRFDAPTDAELHSRVAQEVMSLLDGAGSSTKNLPTGEEILRRCVHAAVGNRKFSVSVLKPNEHMLAQRVPVTDVARFSDGEKLTTCVLLFCAFARMRRRANSVGTATGTLMLDNPFGQASNAQLVALQLAVAKAQKVHLVYATGLEDMGALAQFRQLTRLRNRKAGDGRGHVRAEGERRTGEVTGVSITRPDAPAATWQAPTPAAP